MFAGRKKMMRLMTKVSMSLRYGLSDVGNYALLKK
jgi:hypothetical protein